MTDCRIMPTRACPEDDCRDLPCARFESEDESRFEPLQDAGVCRYEANGETVGPHDTTGQGRCGCEPEGTP